MVFVNLFSIFNDLVRDLIQRRFPVKSDHIGIEYIVCQIVQSCVYPQAIKSPIHLCLHMFKNMHNDFFNLFIC